MITPSEGLNENLALIPDSFGPVDPQDFESITITIIPEPAALPAMLLLAGVSRRRKRQQDCLDNDRGS